jgi:hypothetical protein
MKRTLRTITEKGIKIYDIDYLGKTFTFLTGDDDSGIVTLHKEGTFVNKEWKTRNDEIEQIINKCIQKYETAESK